MNWKVPSRCNDQIVVLEFSLRPIVLSPAIAHRSIDLTFYILLFQSFPFVVQFLAATDPNVDFYDSTGSEIDVKLNQRQAFLGCVLLEFVQLLTMHQPVSYTHLTLPTICSV